MKTFSALLAGHRWIPRQKVQWRGALMFSLILARRTNSSASNGDAGVLISHRAHYDAFVMLNTTNTRQNMRIDALPVCRDNLHSSSNACNRSEWMILIYNQFTLITFNDFCISCIARHWTATPSKISILQQDDYLWYKFDEFVKVQLYLFPFDCHATEPWYSPQEVSSTSELDQWP